MMTPIKRRKRQKFAYHIFARKISCHHYTMSEDDDSVMTGNFTRENTMNFCRFLLLIIVMPHASLALLHHSRAILPTGINPKTSST